MKRTLAVVFTTILVALLVIPATTALADQNFHPTLKIPISLTSEPGDHTLRNGWHMRRHAEGPVNYLIESYMLNGALPDTRYDICVELPGYEGIYFVVDYVGFDYCIQTDRNGNGQLLARYSPDPFYFPPGGSMTWRWVFISGGTPSGGIMVGGTAAFETDFFTVYFD